jgi:hypothetical protein
MRAIVDTTGTTILCTAAPEPRTDDRSQPIVDRETGLPTYVTQVVMVGPDRRTEVVRIVTVSSPDAAVTVGAKLTVTELVQQPWERDGRSGVAYRAKAIGLATDVAAPSPRTDEALPTGPRRG